jgi:hypothetical protein
LHHDPCDARGGEGGGALARSPKGVTGGHGLVAVPRSLPLAVYAGE